MSGRKLRWFTAGLFASAGAGMLSMTAVMNPGFAFGDNGVTPDIIGRGLGDLRHAVGPLLTGRPSSDAVRLAASQAHRAAP